jgi:hypothetical protein
VTGVSVNKRDFIELTISHHGDSVIFFYRNITTNNTIRDARTVNLVNATQYTSLLGYPTIYFAKGNVRLIDYAVSTVQDYDYVVLGNSITYGWGASHRDSTFIDLLRRTTASKINNASRRGAGTTDYLKVRDNYNFRNKVVFLSAVYSVSMYEGRTYEQAKSDYDSLVRIIRGNGNLIVHIDEPYRTTILPAGGWSQERLLNAWIDTAYAGVDSIIHMDSLSSAYYHDANHFNDAGNFAKFQQLYSRYYWLFNRNIKQTGTGGIDFNIAHTAGVETFNIPDASTTSSSRGLVNATTQSFAGLKTFQNHIGIVASASSGSAFITYSESYTAGFARIDAKNTGAGTSASIGALFTNDANHALQILAGSSTNGGQPDMAMIRGSGTTNGLALVADAGDILFANNSSVIANTYARFKNTHLLLNTPTDVTNRLLNVNGVAYVADTIFNPGNKYNNGAACVMMVLDTVTGAQGHQQIQGVSNSYNNQTGTTYTLVSGDNGKVVTLSNASAITLTIPASLPAGFHCTIFQKGAGQVTITASSTTINNRQSFTKTKGQYAFVDILMYASDVFATQGDME